MRCFHKSFLIGAVCILTGGSAAAQTYSGAGFAIPDNNPTGAGSTINVTDSGTIFSFLVTIEFEPTHTFVGDLIATLEHGPTQVDLFRQVGWVTATPGPGDSSNLSGIYNFLDSAPNRLIDVAFALGDEQTITPGNYQATTNTFNGNGAPTFTGESQISLDLAFLGADVNGAWTLNIADIAFGDEGSVARWSITVTTSAVPEPSLVLVGGTVLAGSAWSLKRWRKRKRVAKKA